MSAQRLSYRLSSNRLTCDQIWETDNDLKDLSKDILELLFPEDVEGVRFVNGMIIGRQYSGKTTTLNAIAVALKKRLGSQLNIIADNELRSAMARFNGLPYQLVIIDDPLEKQSSRDSMKNSDLVGEYYRIRHIYKRMTGNTTGNIALIWAPQRLKGLDVFARDVDFIIWKAWTTEEAAVKMLKESLPSAALRRLRDITQEASVKNNQEAKAESVVQFAVTKRTGIIKFPQQEEWILNFPAEELPEIHNVDDFALTLHKVLKDLKKSPKWQRKVEIYQDVVNGMTQAEAAKKHGIKSQSSIAEHIKSLRGEMSRRYGGLYEEYKAKALKSQNARWDVTRLGGQGQPDIIMHDPTTGAQRVYSCKCLDFSQRIYVEQSDFAPELREARNRGCNVHLSVYNLSDGRELPETIICPDSAPERVAFEPITKA